MTRWRRTLAAAALAATVVAPQPARAALWEDAGWGVLTVLGNVGYMPAKVGYALLGTITGGFAYVLTGGDQEVAQNIWDPALGGDYVLTPRMIRGEESITFAAFGSEGAEPAEPPAGDGSALTEETLSRR